MNDKIKYTKNDRMKYTTYVKEINRELDTIIESTDDGLVLVDKDGYVIRVKEAYKINPDKFFWVYLLSKYCSYIPVKASFHIIQGITQLLRRVNTLSC